LINPDSFPVWLSPADENHFVTEFERSGFRGPINRYRNHRRDFEWQQGFRDRRIEQPSLFIGGDRDLVLRMIPGMDMIERMKPHLPGLQGAHLLPGIGHWTQQEAPDVVNRLLVDWLRGLSEQ